MMKSILKRTVVTTITFASLVVAGSVSAQQATNVWDGVYTKAQAVRGKTLYDQHCASCHGSQMQGIEEAPTLKQGAFVYNWDSMPVNVLFQRIRETMPLDDPLGTSRKDKADILAYIMSQNNFPEGATPLPYQNAQLKRIQWNALAPSD